MSDHFRFDVDKHYAVQDVPPPANTDHITRKFLDIPYADLSPAEKLDIYLPEAGGGPYPVIVSIHGGAFMIGDKTDAQLQPMLEGLRRGYAVVALNYRLSGEAEFPALVHDAKAAIRWIRANAARFSLDPDRIAAWGGSAGGYLSTMLGTSAGIAELENLNMGNPEQSSNVQAVIDWFGPTDFLKMDLQLTASGFAPAPNQSHSGENSPESLLLGGKITEIPDRVRAANPETYIRPNAPPFLIQHGVLDAVVPVQQSIDLAVKLRSVAGEQQATLLLIEDAGHGDPKFETEDNVAKMLNFLDRHLKL